MTDWYYATLDFLDAGGGVLKLLALVIVLLWLLTFERLFYLFFTYRHVAIEAIARWRARPDPGSWNSEQIRAAWISRLNESASGTLPFIKALVSICPLLGLLGTVTGMISIFDAMSVTGTSNVRSVAEGVSRATITTMAGMVAALAGLFGLVLIARENDALRNRVREAFSKTASRSTTIDSPRRGRFLAPLRMFLSFFLAVVAAALLLTLMQVLIATGKSAITDSETVYFVDFIRVPEEEQVQRKERKVEKPSAVEEPPEFTPQESQFLDNPGANVVSLSAPAVGLTDADLQFGGLSGLPVSDGDYLPIVKVLPIYPRAAVQLGMEGFVIVEFTVTTSGSVRDPIVVESTHVIFEKPAIKAALKFKYKPRIVDGQPIEVHGVQNKIIFEVVDL